MGNLPNPVTYIQRMAGNLQSEQQTIYLPSISGEGTVATLALCKREQCYDNRKNSCNYEFLMPGDWAALRIDDGLFAKEHVAITISKTVANPFFC